MVKVSVALITYNHESFIRQCIDSILMQDFRDFELIVADDASTDNTVKIIKEMVEGTDIDVKFLDSSVNIGISKNFIRMINACSGEYIALIDGDDYWVDPGKLRKQSKFLDKNTDFDLIFARARVLRASDCNKFSNYIVQNKPKEEYTIKDVMNELFMPTCTVMVRNLNRNKLPKWMEEWVACDKQFHLLNLQYGGRIKYVHQPMGVYRVHNQGVWSMKDDEVKREFTRLKINMLKNFDEDTNYKFHDMIQKAIFHCKSKIIISSIKDNIPLEVENLGEIQGLASNFLSQKNVYIFGTGEAGKNTYFLCKKFGIDVTGFFDNDKTKQGQKLFDREIYSIKKLKQIDHDKPIFIVVGSMYYKEISKQLDSLGLEVKKDYIHYTEVLNNTYIDPINNK